MVLHEGMRRVQVTGLPGAGKTTGIETFLGVHPHSGVSFLDIRNFDPPDKEQKFWEAITTTPGPLIAESAIGVLQTDTWIVRLEPPIQQVYQQCLRRDGEVDEDYLSILTSIMIPAHHIIEEPGGLPRLLTKLLIK